MAFSKEKNRVLLALSSGVKLHEFMRERDAPAKSMLEEWRNHDPEFEAAYQQAVEEGRVKRGEPAPKPAPIIADQDGREHAIPRSTALRASVQAWPEPARVENFPHSDEPDPRAFKDEAPAPTRSPSAEQPALVAAGSPTPAAPAVVAEPAAKPDRFAAARAAKAAKRATGEATPAPKPAQLAADIQAHVQQLEQKVAALGDFKAYVHERLDAAGIAPHTEQNAVNGCRIGARLDDVFQREAHAAERAEGAERENQELARQVAELLEAATRRNDEPGKGDPIEIPVFPSPAPRHPGLVLADAMRQIGTLPYAFAGTLGIGYSTLKSLLAGRTAFSISLCAKLEQFGWGTAETWCRRQVDFDTYHKAQPQAA